MLTKTLLALSLVAGSTFILNSYQPRFKTSSNPQQIVTQLPQQEIETIARNITVKVRNAENEGSGILIAKDNDTYTVITNASLTDGEIYTIQTPDGMEYEAIVTEDNPENDLAILEFTSNEQYQTATIGNSDSLTAGETVIAAGFSESKAELLVTEGKISLVTEKPLSKGYSIGFTNETVQGMSGGVLLNANGEVIGVLGKGKGAILDTAYDYADGTTPTDDEIATFREVAFSIPIQNIANLSPQLAQLVPGNSNPEIPQQPEYTGIVKTVDDIAQQITVRIATAEKPSYGSGVIIARDDDTYYVATVAHNFPEGESKSYQIVTPNGESYELDIKTVEKSDAYDFAIFSFTSEKDYTIATVGNYTVAANDDQVVFTSGFPGMSASERFITGGKVREQIRTSFNTKDSSSFVSTTADRPGLLYSNLSYKGMSGGAVLDSQGRLVGINVGAENELYYDESGNYEEFSLGFSLGIPFQDILNFLESETSLKTEWLQITKEPAAKVSESDYSSIQAYLLDAEPANDDADLTAWMNYGNQLWRYEQYSEAVDAFEKVVSIDPNFDRGYYAIGLTYWDLGDLTQAATALAKATQINPNPYFYWRRLGHSYYQLERFDEAVLAYERAIALTSQDFVLYVELGDILYKTKRYDEAIASYDKALSLNPDHPWIYNNQGKLYYEQGEIQLALDNFNKAISLNPDHANAYYNRGKLYYEQGEIQLALDNFNKAISLNPNHTYAYSYQSLIYRQQGEIQLALDDYNSVISINPNDADAYYNRGSYLQAAGRNSISP